MRLVRCAEGERCFAGQLDGEEVLELGHGLAEGLERLADGRRPNVVRRHQLADLVLLPPIADGAKSFWVGANYTTLIDNRTGRNPEGEWPSLFQRVPESLAAHGQPLLRPAASEQLDYEGEIVLVVGRGGRNIAAADWRNHVGGVTIANDGTIRDWLHHSRVNVTPGKNFDASGSLGPWISTADALDLYAEKFTIETRVNGELRQRDDTSNLRFSFGRLIAYVSRFTTLAPGDLISTGSPSGAGGGPFGFDPPRWLVPGDELEISVSQVGTLRNCVADGP